LKTNAALLPDRTLLANCARGRAGRQQAARRGGALSVPGVQCAATGI